MDEKRKKLVVKMGSCLSDKNSLSQNRKEKKGKISYFSALTLSGSYDKIYY